MRATFADGVTQTWQKSPTKPAKCWPEAKACSSQSIQQRCLLDFCRRTQANRINHNVAEPQPKPKSTTEARRRSKPIFTTEDTKEHEGKLKPKACRGQSLR